MDKPIDRTPTLEEYQTIPTLNKTDMPYTALP